MTELRQAAQMALEALEWSWGGEPRGTMERDAITALQAALAGCPHGSDAACKECYEGEPEPVAWIEHGLIEAPDGLVWERGEVGRYTPLYTAARSAATNGDHMTTIYATAAEAIERSTRHAEIARCEPTSANRETLLDLCDDSAEADEHEFWGTDDLGNEWRVHVPAHGIKEQEHD